MPTSRLSPNRILVTGSFVRLVNHNNYGANAKGGFLVSETAIEGVYGMHTIRLDDELYSDEGRLYSS